MPALPIPVPPPLRATTRGVPIVYEALGAIFHLEAPTPDDEDAFTQVNEIVRTWFGDELRWTLLSTFSAADPFEPTDLDYLPFHARSLKPPVIGPGNPQLQLRIASEIVGRFAMACHGGRLDWDAHPYSYRFFGEPTSLAQCDSWETSAMLRITVPATWPAEDFRERVLAVASCLRFRWGAAGLMYSGWEIDHYNATREAMLAHARRFPGFDLGFYAGYLPVWDRYVRSINWLTLLGPEFRGRLEAAGRPRLPQAPLVTSFELGKNLVLQAGAAPQTGDVNRLDYPPAYVQADEIVRPVRAARGVDFAPPWDARLTETWLRRFERPVPS